MNNIVKLKSYNSEGLELGDVFPISKSDAILFDDETNLTEKINNVNTIIGNHESLKTTNKDSIVNAINELFQYVSNGKNSIASAITDKGVHTSNLDSFEKMAENISKITSNQIIAPTANLICWLDAKECEGTNVSWKDKSGNNNNFEYLDGNYSFTDNVLRINNGRLRCDFSKYDFNNKFTIIIKYKVNSIPSGTESYLIPLQKADNGWVNGFFIGSRWGEKSVVGIRVDGGYNVPSKSVANDDTTKMAINAFVVDRENGKTISYKDNDVKLTRYTEITEDFNKISYITIGGFDTGNYGFNGDIEYIKIFDNALSDSEIISHFY